MKTFHQRIGPTDAECIWQTLHQSNFIDAQAKTIIVHDMGRMRARLRNIQSSFPGTALHALAIKANPLLEVLREAVGCGAGLEAASLEELRLALAAGCAPEKIVFDSPAKTESEIDEALKLGVHLNANGFDELHRIARYVSESPTKSPVGLRINPEVSAGAISDTSVGSVGSKFGVSLSRDRAKIVESFQQYPWLTGLHVHVGSQGCGMDLLATAVEKVAKLQNELVATAERSIPWLNIGGGLPARYDDDSDPPSPQEYATELKRRVPSLWQNDTKLVTEFGRSVQTGCGIALSRVEYARACEPPEAEGMMAVIHLGADFLLRPVYRSSDWKHEFLVLDHQGEIKTAPTRTTTIAGPLCFAGDMIARQIDLPEVVAGDWIAIRDCGAYTLSMWSRHCSRGIPAVVGYDSEADQPADTGRLLRRGESPEDIVKFWSL